MLIIELHVRPAVMEWSGSTDAPIRADPDTLQVNIPTPLMEGHCGRNV